MLRHCIGALVAALGIAGAGETVVANWPPPPSIAVMVINEAAVPPNVLARAEMEAARIYERVGVSIDWVDGAGGDRAYGFIIKVVARTLSINEVGTNALGVTPGAYGVGAKMAYVFYGRIRGFSELHSVEISPILGHVMAHELGHLLLPHHPHSRTGLMSSGWDAERAVRAGKGLLTFSEAESMLIRNHSSVHAAASNRRLPNGRASVRTDKCDWPRMS